MSSEVLLSIQNIKKAFPGVQALDGVSFDVKKGELHALLGENGAGKSTVIKSITGLYKINGGKICFDGKQLADVTPATTISLGICTVYQELTLAKDMTVAENIFMGRWPRKKGGMVDYRKLYSDARELLDKLGFDIDPKIKVSKLTVAFQQLTEIARVLSMRPKLVIFDEPTAVLGENEKEKLFKCIAELKKNDVGIIYISHRMKEVFEIADRMTILRDGKLVKTIDGADATYEEVVSLMVGRNVDIYDLTSQMPFGGTVLEVKNYSRSEAVRDVSFSVRAHEVIGFYGLIGAGRTEMARLIYGLDKKESGELLLEAKWININDPVDAIGNGIGLLPEDRRAQGLVLELDVKNNVSISNLDNIKGRVFIDNKKEKSIAKAACGSLKLKATGLGQVTRTLSGGNQQKVVVAKWITRVPVPKVLIFDEPTRGIDVGAKYEIHKIIRDLADQGMAVIMISSDMLEILSVSDRIAVMREGRIRGELTHAEATEEKIIFMAAHE